MRTTPPDFYVAIAAFYKLFGKKFVFDHHDLSPEMYQALKGSEVRPVLHKLLVWFEKRSCRVADHVIATNESYKRMHFERSGIPPERVTVVRNGPDLERWNLMEPDPLVDGRAETIIGYVGDMGFHDGLDYLLRSMKHLVYELGRKDVLCMLIGSGSAVPSLKRMTSDLQLEPYVWFPGYLNGDALVRHLSTANICVVPDPKNPYSDRSTMIKLAEYMALSKPIVAFDLTEHRVTAEDAAVYAEPNDEADFADHIARLMDDPDRCAEMGRPRTAARRIDLGVAVSDSEVDQCLREDLGIRTVLDSSSLSQTTRKTGLPLVIQLQGQK